MTPTADAETILADLKLNRELTVRMTTVGTLGMVVGWAAFSAVYQVGTGAPPTFDFAPPGVGWWNDALDLLVLLFLGTVFIVPHEWLHGLAIRYYGGEPRYGVGLAHFVLPYAYATTDHEFSRNEFVVVLLTPLVGLTLVGVPVMLAFEWGWLVVPLALNAAGAVADVWMTLTVLSYPAHVRIRDHEAGVRILGRAGDRTSAMSVTALAWDALSGAAVAAFATFLLLGVGGPLVLSALGVKALTVGTPGTFTYLFSFVDRPDEISLGVGPGVLSVGALAGLTFALARTYRRGRGDRGRTGAGAR